MGGDEGVNTLELTEHANEFLSEYYNMKLTIPIKINNRLRSTLGEFVYTKNGAKEIQMSGYLIKYGTLNTILDTLKHELIHYAMYTQKRQYRDGTREFENELIRHEVGSTGTVYVGKFVRYSCSKCKKKYETEWMSVSKNPEKYRSTCCKETIIVQGEVVYNGEEDLVLS
jgi:predicted SprT family Zn-dependent metalloprotease